MVDSQGWRKGGKGEQGEEKKKDKGRIKYGRE